MDLAHRVIATIAKELGDHHLAANRCDEIKPGGGHRTCMIEGCNRPHRARGFCQAHWLRWSRHGDPLAGGPSREGARLAFVEAAVRHEDAQACLLWPFSIGRGGYGSVHVNRVQMPAHRLVCQRAHGPAPTEKHEVAHTCGNGGCVNPHHLRWATHRENEADKLRHGTRLFGERNHLCRLTATDVEQIRGMGRTVSRHEIARRFKITPSYVSGILTGRQRKNG